MKKRAGLWFVLILILTALAAIINLSQPYTINIESPNLPIINKKISIHQKFNGIISNLYIGPIHIKKDFSFRKGLDLEGGTSITLKADMSGIPASQKEN